MRRIYWSGREHDRFFGPFTYSSRDYARWGVMFSSAGDDDENGAYGRLHLAGFTLLWPMPNWLLRPAKEKVVAKYWSPEQIERNGGQNWYWDIHQRDFGVYATEGALHAHYGRQTGDSTTDRNKVFFLPWFNTRRVRHEAFDTDGTHFALVPENYEAQREMVRLQPHAVFVFRDYDGENLTAYCRIEETEYKQGTGWFKWLSLFVKPKVFRSVDITYSGEVGRRKGSWKGGTIGTSIRMLPGETLEQAFLRRCEKDDLRLVERLDDVIGNPREA